MANIRTVDYGGFDHATGSAATGSGFMIWSGSMQLSKSLAYASQTTQYYGVGIEAIAHSGSYLRFQTDTDGNQNSSLDIRTNRFFLGSDDSFISGSGDGTIAISSSNFELDETGAVVMQGTITAEAGGTIGGWSIGTTALSSSNNSVLLDSNGPYFISSSGFQVDGIGAITASAGSIAGWGMASSYLANVNASGGVKLDSGNKVLTFRTGSSSVTEIIKVGNLGSNKYGILGLDSSDSTKTIFKIGEDGNEIAGWTIADQTLTGGALELNKSGYIKSGTSWKISSSAATSDPAGFISSSDFKVSANGRITASAGLIAGFSIIGDNLDSVDGTLKLDGGSTPTVKVLKDSDDFVEMFFNNTSDYGLKGVEGGSAVFKLGSTNEIAGWSFDNEKLIGGNLILNKEGSVKTSDYVSNLQGFSLSAVSGGFLEVENAKIRGTLSTAVFEKETVNAVGGQLYIANSTALTGSVIPGQTSQGGLYTPSDTTMSVVNVTGFEVNEILSMKKMSSTGFATEYVKIVSSSRQDSDSETNFSGNIMVERGYGNGVTATPVSQSLGEVPEGAQSYSGSQVIVSTGKIGTGFIRLNANPNDQTTPYMDIVERTGSGIYDVKLKARLGDLSGIADNVNGTDVSGFGLYTDNAFLKGGIVATYGSIGGFGVNASTISSSNGVLVMRDNGEITGSNVLLTGGKIGGYTISGNKLSVPTKFHLSSSSDNTDPVGFISSSAFKVSADGRITASGALIDGDSTFKGSIEVKNGSGGPGANLYQHNLTHHPRSAGTPADSILPNAGWNDAADNAIEYVTGPFGQQELAITCYPDAASDGDGGFNTDPIPIDPTFGYMFVGYIKRTTNPEWGTSYFGTEGLNDAGADDYIIKNQSSGYPEVNDNPYFFNGDVIPSGEAASDSLDRWFLHVGYVYPSGSPVDTSRKGVCYDLTTGLTASYSNTSGASFMWHTGATKTRLRMYHYYNSGGDTNTKYAEIARPGIYKMDGSEPTIQSLLSNVSTGDGTKIDGSTITTGKILSSNYAANAGSELDLDAGTIKLGGYSSPAFSVTSAGVMTATGGIFSGNVTATTGNIGGWTLGASTLTGGNMQINNTGKIVTSTDSNTTRIEIDGTADPAELRFYSASSAHFEATTNISHYVDQAIAKNGGNMNCVASTDSGLSGIELRNDKAGIMSSVGGSDKQIKMFPGHIKVNGARNWGNNSATSYTGDFIREFTNCNSVHDSGGVTAAVRGYAVSDVNDDSGAAQYRAGVYGVTTYNNAFANINTVGVYAESSNNGSGTAYSFFGAAGKFINYGDSQLGNHDSSGVNNVQLGKAGSAGTGINYLRMYGEGDGHDGQSCNEIQMFGHEGRAQGIRFSDTDYPNKHWWAGTTYQGYQNWFIIGFDDATAQFARKGAAVLAVIGPSSTNAVNSAITNHGSVRICDWDNLSDQSSPNSEDYLWMQHNGDDARLGAKSGHFDFHNSGDEDTGTHNIRFGDDGSLHVNNMNTYSSGGSTVKWHGGELKRSSSTRKVKKEIKPIKNDNSAIINFNKLRPVEYKQKLDNLITYGFIAEEIAEVDPKLAVWDKDYTRDEKGQLVDTGERVDKKRINKLDSDKIVPGDLEDRAILALAVAKIQQLEERIKELESK